jgi:hypothetical protein
MYRARKFDPFDDCRQVFSLNVLFSTHPSGEDEIDLAATDASTRGQAV